MIDQLTKSRSVLVGLLVLVALLTAVTGARIYRNYSVPGNQFDWSNRGHSDFHNGAYYLANAYRDGVNPYSVKVKEGYPVAAPSRPCPPIVFLLHLPFTFLDLATADIVFFFINWSMLALLAFLSIRFSLAVEGVDRSAAPVIQKWVWFLVLFVWLLVSRPGHITLFTGYTTLELVLGTVVALHFADRRPWLSGMGMLLASGKPTYVLPLIVLMVCRRNVRAVLIGIVMCTVAGLAGLGWLATFSTPQEVVAGIVEGQTEFHDDVTEYPVNTWTRVDLMSIVAKMLNWIPSDRSYLLGMFLLTIVPGWVLLRYSPYELNRGATGLTAFIVVLTILLAIYHHSYDCLLVTVPWAGLVLFGSITLPELSRVQRYLVALLTAVPAVNYISTQSVRDRLQLEQLSPIWQAITMVNSVCLLLALGTLMYAALRYHQRESTGP